MGPTIGPIVGGFVGETVGWRWIEGIMAIFTGVIWLAGGILVPETYGPVLLRARAARLSKVTNKVYRSKGDVEQGELSIGVAFKTSLSRPWVLLLREPIVFLLSVYLAIVYGALYMLFASYPIVYQETRGWSQGIGGLPFLGVAVGMLLAVAYSAWDNARYVKVMKASPGGFAPPEARLPPAMVGGVAIPIGLFWFAWTNGPNIQFMASIAAGVPFGFGTVLVFLSVLNFLIDGYIIFAASVLAANAVLRSLFGAVFPLFTPYMYQGLGIHWASSIPAFLALACTPLPFLFYKYGPAIRKRCKFAAEADAFLQKLREQDDDEPASSESPEDQEKRAKERREAEEDREAEAIDYSYEDETSLDPQVDSTRFQRIRTNQSLRRQQSNVDALYEGNPFDLDRVNTRESFARAKGDSRASSLKSKRSNKSLKGAARK